LLVEQGNDYVVCVKANQGRLYHWIEGQWQKGQPQSSFQNHERRHGRETTWTVSVFEQLGDFAQEWAGLKCCISVERHGTRSSKAYAERQYYISSAALSAERFDSIIRCHWQIENRLHWVKDVVFAEDDSAHRHRFAAANWSVVRNIFLNLARGLGFTSMATAKRALANQWQRILSCIQ
jgi:predicted transposase YbfD/YdcC